MSVSVVVPCYNEGERLKTQEFLDFVHQHGNVEFVFVDDGSTDDTQEVLRVLVRSDPQRFRIFTLHRNFGKAEAVRQGILLAIASEPVFVAFWDADLATPLDQIPTFCHCLDNNPNLAMVLGARVRMLGRKIDRQPLRHYLGRVFATAASAILRMPVYDTQCGAKMFRITPELRQLFAEPFQSKWVFDVELLARYSHIMKRLHRSIDGTIVEYPLEVWRDVGDSKLRSGDFIRAPWELGLVYWRYMRPRCCKSVSLESVAPARSQGSGERLQNQAVNVGE